MFNQYADDAATWMNGRLFVHLVLRPILPEHVSVALIRDEKLLDVVGGGKHLVGAGPYAHVFGEFSQTTVPERSTRNSAGREML